jgi:16S rRNA (guanine527-N7)-methyltransferase
VLGLAYNPEALVSTLMQPVRTNRIADSAEFARVFGVSRETLARLETYARLLKTWQKTINLVAPSTLDDIWHRHFADSAQVLGVWDALSEPATRSPLPLGAAHPGPLPTNMGRGSDAAPLHWVDLGSGAGLPGLVVGILLAERGANRLTLVDSDQRKAAFLREVVRETGLKSQITVEIVAERIESPANRSKPQPASVVSARALAPLPKLLTWAEPYFGPATVGVFLKGREAAAEVEAAADLPDWALSLQPSLTHAEARIVVARRRV